MNKFIIQSSFIILLFINQALCSEKSITSQIKVIKDYSKNLHGGAFAVLENGKIIHKETFGYTKIGGKAVTPSSLFPLASVSKTITALAILKLVNDGKVSLDEKFSLPYLKFPISLIEVLSNTSGYKFSGNIEIESGFSRKKLLDKLKNQSPVCDNCYFYSNAIFSLVDEILVQKGLSLKFAIDNFAASLGTKDIQLSPLIEKSEAIFRHSDNKEILYSNYHFAVPASAGIYASLNEIIEVLNIISGNKKFISNRIMNELVAKKTISAGDAISAYFIKNYKNIKPYYGAGIRILKFYGDKEIILHSGKISGMWAFIGFNKSNNIGVIFMHNGHKKEVHSSKLLSEIISLMLEN